MDLHHVVPLVNSLRWPPLIKPDSVSGTRSDSQRHCVGEVRHICFLTAGVIYYVELVIRYQYWTHFQIAIVLIVKHPAAQWTEPLVRLSHIEVYQRQKDNPK